MKYIKKRFPVIFLIFSICIFYNLYFLFLVTLDKPADLFYLDFLILIFCLFIGAIDFSRFSRKERLRKTFLEMDSLIWRPELTLENADLMAHDAEIYRQQYEQLYESHCDLQDYITKWCHEVKIPLSAAFLMQERISDQGLRSDLKMQLTKISHLLATVLVGCKVESQLYDIQIKSVGLSDCVRTSIRNQQFFLIQKHFELDIEYRPLTVYTDKEWLVYILDQLINNAVKYTQGPPFLKIRMFTEGQNTVLTVEDHGEGIEPSDLSRIFDKGYTGANHHNGQYRSTGMGLYMVRRMAQKLGHNISVESEPGKYTRFTITFTDNRDYFHLI